MSARYDGTADWYDQHVAWTTAGATPLILRLSGAGPGRCLDLGCGTGVHLSALANAGWWVAGMDASADQLRVASQRIGPLAVPLVQADAGRLPFVAGSFSLVVSAFTHSDVEDFLGLARGVRRILEPAGRFVYVGLHPCFTGPFAPPPRDDGARVIYPGYGQAGWQTSGPGVVDGGLTSRVGFRHLPLAELLNCVLGAGLRLHRVEEGGNQALPDWLALVAGR